MSAGTIAILILVAMNVAYNLAKHGEEKEGEYDFWTSLIEASIWIALLYWAGNFD